MDSFLKRIKIPPFAKGGRGFEISDSASIDLPKTLRSLSTNPSSVLVALSGRDSALAPPLGQGWR
jgi:hypothetical protein